MTTTDDERLRMQDPRHQYVGPPFSTEEQPSPGLAARMAPPPDHGETSYRGHGRLAGREALITGGDSGISRAAAIAFACEGADAAFGHLPSEEEDARAVVGLGGLDILVNDAGAQSSQPDFLAITTEHFDRTLKTNLYAMFWITKAAIPHMPPGGSIINTASVQAYQPSQGIIDYALTKAGIVDFTKGLAKQVLERGLRVNAVAPGPFWTPLQPSGGEPMDKVAQFGRNVPMGRPGQPVELAPVYVFLASQEASYVTGEVYGVTGGIGIA